MSASDVRPAIDALSPYVPGLSIAEIREKYGLANVVKMASNENPLGASPLATEAVRRHAAEMFRYPQGGNPRLVAALAARHGVDAGRIVVGNGSDELLDMLIRMRAEPGRHNVVCFRPCFAIYPIQSQICGVEARRQPLREDFSFDFDALLSLTDADTRLVFVTTPDNPSGWCPPRADVAALARDLERRAPDALLVIDEAYVDFAGEDESGEAEHSLLAAGELPENAAALRTFSKSYGLAGIRLGYGVLPAGLAGYFWRSRPPFSVNILAEEAGLAALEDAAFRAETLRVTREGRRMLTAGLRELGFTVWPSHANFLMCRPGDGMPDAGACYEGLLRRGVIIRALRSYDMPGHLRISVGTREENTLCLAGLRDIVRGEA